MKKGAFLLRGLLVLCLLVWGFQNCSPDNFATHGNGTPYEGINDPPTENPGGIGENPPPPDKDPGSEQNAPPEDPIENLNSLCIYNHSQFFTDVKVGTDRDGIEKIQLTLAGGGKILKRLDPGQSQVPIDYSNAQFGLKIEMILLGNDSVSVMYKLNEGPLHNEFTTCTES